MKLEVSSQFFFARISLFLLQLYSFTVDSDSFKPTGGVNRTPSYASLYTHPLRTCICMVQRVAARVFVKRALILMSSRV